MQQKGIKIQEFDKLRIGNYVISELYQQDKLYTTVDSDFLEKVDFVKYDGIVLTEELILKLGFSKTKTKNIFYKDKFVIYMALDVFLVWYNSVSFLDIFRYVHELQNIYFSRLNEELIF